MLTIRIDGSDALNDNSHKAIKAIQPAADSLKVEAVHIDSVDRHYAISFSQFAVTPGGAPFRDCCHHESYSIRGKNLCNLRLDATPVECAPPSRYPLNHIIYQVGQ